jgi:T4 RnlA family RNA ligase
MRVIEYLNEYGVENLKQELGIIVKDYDELLVLNYSQINSPKIHPIVVECRGLILDKQFNVVSRGFDRFFNLGEAPGAQMFLDWSRAACYEKVDGSLIKIYNYQGHWYVSTRGTAFAESTVNGFPDTFYKLVLKSLGIKSEEEFQSVCNDLLDEEWTYIFELTSLENQVVKRYEGYTLHYLAARHNNLGGYGDWYERSAALQLGANIPAFYRFSSRNACVESAKHLKDLDEGYVVHQDGVPVCKVKSPLYVAAHYIRGEGLSQKRIMQMVLNHDHDEYLKYFPGDERFFAPYIQGLEELLSEVESVWQVTSGLSSRKEFALAVKDKPYSALLFQGRGEGGYKESIFHQQTDNYKFKLLEEWASHA